MKDSIVKYLYKSKPFGEAQGKQAQGYLVVPEKYTSGVIVIQEWWGLNENIKDITRRVAELGYVALAPDLYNGKVAEEPDEAQKLRMEMQIPKAIKVISAASDYLRNEKKAQKVAVIGFCMGGSLALAAASATDKFDLAIPFYGRVIDETRDNLDKIKIPILGLYGSRDHGIPVEVVHGLKKDLDELGVVNEFHIYEADHAFFNDTRESYDKEASDDAWEKVKTWLQRYI